MRWEELQANYLLIVAFSALIGIPVSFCLEKDRRNQPTKDKARSYKWGYFMGWTITCAHVIVALWLIIYGIIENKADYFFFSCLFFVYAYLGLGVLLRQRWLFLLSVIFSFNPIVWLINGNYIENRWGEMKKEAEERRRLKELRKRTTNPHAVRQVELNQGLSLENAFISQSIESNEDYYIGINYCETGPYTMEEVRLRWNAGQIPGNSLYWKEGMNDWSPLASDIENLGSR